MCVHIYEHVMPVRKEIIEHKVTANSLTFTGLYFKYSLTSHSHDVVMNSIRAFKKQLII